MRRLKLRPSPAMVVAVVALFLAAGGVSYATVTISGAMLKNRSVAGSKLKKHTLTGTEINVSRLAKVPSAATADTATDATHAAAAEDSRHAATADNAAHADLATSTSVVSIHGTKIVDAAADFGSAQRVSLGSKGPFSFYGKCYLGANGRVVATTYIASTSPTAMFDTEAADSGYVTPSTPEANRRLQDVFAIPNSFVAGRGDKDFMATDGTTTIYGVVGLAAAKAGSPVDGDGPFGPGNRCMFGEAVIG